MTGINIDGRGLTVSDRGVEVGQVASGELQTYDFDSDTIGDTAPGPWVNQGYDIEVGDTYAYSGTQSYEANANPGDDIEIATVSFDASQYTQTFSHKFNESESSGNSTVKFTNSDGDALFYIGSNNPQIAGDAGNGYFELTNGTYDIWQELRATIDWQNQNVFVEFGSPGFSSPSHTATEPLRSVSTYDLAEISLSSGPSSFGGQGFVVRFDDVDIIQ